jgi:hypothetical protein
MIMQDSRSTVSHPLCVFMSFETLDVERSDTIGPRRVHVCPGVRHR